MNNGNVQQVDTELVQMAKDLLKVEYTHNRHHVAVALRAGGGIYKSLHMGSKGFDVCAEPIAIHNALQNNESIFHQIVAIACADNGEFKIISPYGNCRQILLEYTPDISIVLDDKGKLKLYRPSDLLPEPYIG